jgi:WD40 repeat protein
MAEAVDRVVAAARRFARVRQLFEAGLDLPEDERAAWLAPIAEREPELATEVQRLFRCDAGPGPVFEPPAAGDLLAACEAAGCADLAGQRVGAWLLLARLGAGGMGTVWLAERADGCYEQRVALKLIEHGVADAGLLRRFELERQVLAELDHPGLIRLVDGGTTADGRPFLVMPFVDGIPLDRSSAQRGLGLAARVELVERICDAVEHAHRHGVVHGDLKPQNILVDRRGAPVVLDFGIAHLLRARSVGDGTDPGSKAWTPARASPEQVRGEPLTPASDVFALGVLVRELTTGVGPGPGCGPRGDLARIVQRATEEDPARRYPGAAALGDDLARWRARRPIAARRPSLRYRALLFAARHARALAIGLAALALAALAVGWLASSVGGRARIAEYRARLAAAFAALAVDDVVAAARELEAAPAALRGFEWQHARTRLDQCEALVDLGDVRPTSLTVHPTEGWALVGTATGELLRIRDGALEVTAAGQGLVHDLRFDPSGEVFVGAIQEQGFGVWDARSLTRRADFGSAVQRPRCIAVDPDFATAVCGHLDGSVEQRGLPGGELLRAWPPAPAGVQAVAVGAATAVVGSLDGRLSVRDLATGAERAAVDCGAAVEAVALSADRSLALAGLRDGRAVLIDAREGARLAGAVAARDAVVAVAASNAGWFVASADRTLRALPRSLGDEGRRTFCGHRAAVRGLWVEAGGASLVSVGEDRSLRRWSAAAGEVEAVRLPAGWFMGLALAPDGASAAVWTGAEPSSLSLVDLDLMRTRWSVERPAAELVLCGFARGGRAVLAVAEAGSYPLFDARTGVRLGGPPSVEGPPEVEHGRILDFALAPDQARLALGLRGGALLVVDLQSGAVLVRDEAAHAHATSSLRFSPDGAHLLSGGWDGRVVLRDAKTLVVRAELGATAEGIWQVAFDPAGRRVAAASWEPCVLLGPADGSARLRRLDGHTGKVYSVAFSADGTRLASGSEDRTVRIWHAARGDELAVLVGHGARVDEVAFTADGAALVSLDARGELRAWRAGQPR